MNKKTLLAFIVFYLSTGFYSVFAQAKTNFRLEVTISVNRFYSKIFVSKISEKIVNFEAKYWIEKDSSVKVKEKIEYDFGANLRHGIFRYIPYVYRAGDKDFELELSGFRVVDDLGRC